MKFKFTLFAVLFISAIPVWSQIDTATLKSVSTTPGLVGDTSSMLTDIDILEFDQPDYVNSTFKGNRIINSQSIEMMGKQNLDFRISHRFGAINSGAYDLFGLDQAYQRMSFTYGISDLVNIEIGRSSVNKVYDGTVKFKLMRQVVKDKKRPVSMVFLSNIAVNTIRISDPNQSPYPFTNRLFYTHQLLIARKFNKYFSLQLMPTVLHRNFIENSQYKNTTFNLGIGGRNKISKKTAITYEYFYVLPNQINEVNMNSLSLGVDIETGGHVFQLHLTNSLGMNEFLFLNETKGDWMKGGIHFGFNISRVFYIGR
jgi:hypothetical protein